MNVSKMSVSTTLLVLMESTNTLANVLQVILETSVRLISMNVMHGTPSYSYWIFNTFSYIFADLASTLCHVKMGSMNTPVIVFLGMKVSIAKLAKPPETAISVMVAVLEALYSILIEHCQGP